MTAKAVILMEINQNKNDDTSNKGSNPVVSAQILALSVFYLFFYVQTAHAGVFDFITKRAEADAKIANIPSSRLAILSTNIYDANMANNAYTEIVTVSGNDALIPIIGPGGTVLDIDGDYIPETDTISVYVVKNGDTIATIAKEFGVSTNTIIWANGLKKGQSLKEGVSLTILPVTGVRYTVKKGDTIASIAKKLSADVEDIKDYNGIDNPDLKIGMSIIVPDGEIKTSPPTLANNTTKNTKTVDNSKAKTDEKNTSGPVGSVFDLSGPKSGQKVILSKRGQKTWGFDAPSAGDYYIHPVPGSVKTQDLHGFNGIDFGAPTGTPIVASASGRVIVAKNSGYNGGYGLYIVIAHDNGTQTLYSHNSRNFVSVGDYVEQGQRIALVGSTGRSTGPHLHFEVRGAKNPFAGN